MKEISGPFNFVNSAACKHVHIKTGPGILYAMLPCIRCAQKAHTHPHIYTKVTDYDVTFNVVAPSASLLSLIVLR